jgi:hypothetical protein
VPLILVAQVSRSRAPLALMRRMPALFRCKWELKPSLVYFALPICKESKQAYCAKALMARSVCSPAPLRGMAPFFGHAGWVEGSCAMSRRFHEAVLRVVASLSWGPGSLLSRAKRLPAVLARP